MQRLALLNNQFAHIPMAPADPILGLSAGFKVDKNPNKVNLGVGAYRDNDGKPFVFPIVRKVEAEIVADKKLDKEYLPIDGLQTFNTGARQVLFGWEHKDVNSGRVATVQTLSGTGALRVIADFLKKFKPSALYVSNPTWGNHGTVFAASGLQVRQYRYFDKKTRGLDIEGMIKDLDNAQPGSVVLLHTCAHNPTGVDPTEQ
jgi:aspartate/tyrosine/aromatic aminotransferase